ncbi:PD-(D/E)XK nuclease family protein [Azospirillum brasilense]|uniref:PD-(D/E)XK nuclease family protein n=1 Tax=Azospirillum brasilense TaxID=192 RepID=UPI001EDC17CA|nr:PD-(D/E)XK nuclease family protein [Azospirillum brasilense]UKJ75422.1 PD-(D/E)XK nuclease family protein [Azospirillum brasilense]
MRCTVIVGSELACRMQRHQLAMACAHGTQILSVCQMAARLAGGFVEPVRREALLEGLWTALAVPGYGELDDVRELPGTVRAAAATLTKAWTAGFRVAALKDHGGRLEAMARLEEAVLAALPRRMLPHPTLCERAMANVGDASRLLGPVTFDHVDEVDTVWRDLVLELARHVRVTWRAVRPPAWLDGSEVVVERPREAAPSVAHVACAGPRHEVVEALRWARGLIAEGRARPDQIAIVSVDPGEWDDDMAAAVAESSLPVHFAHGRAATSLPEGQACAALARILLHGLSQDRVRRLVPLLRSVGKALGDLPPLWQNALPPDAALTTVERWKRLLNRVEDTHGSEPRTIEAVLLPVLELAERGPQAAKDAGEALLSGRALAIWRAALREAAPEALEVVLRDVRGEDPVGPEGAIVWASACEVAQAPRPFVRMLGLTSRAWPRRSSDDPLLPQRLLKPIGLDLDPDPVPMRDRRHFAVLMTATGSHVVLSRSRRDAEGRRLGKSPLVPAGLTSLVLPRSRVPEHAYSESDRMLARADEFAGTALARSAASAWEDWSSARITPHDGLVRRDHPLIVAALEKPQSATSLRLLLRDPLGWLWRYPLGWKDTQEAEEPLALDALAFGNLVHETLQGAVAELEAVGGFAQADRSTLEAAVERACTAVALRWETEQPVPPAVMWDKARREAMSCAVAALSVAEPPLAGQRSWTELPFGNPEAQPDGGLPWDPRTAVPVPGTGLRINGVIDRLDVSDDRTQARVTDYKTGKVPSQPHAFVLGGGKELQRCLYTFAVETLLGNGVAVETRLLYPREGQVLPLPDPQTTLGTLTAALQAAAASMRAGRALPGPDAADPHNRMAIALPANARRTYWRRKEGAVRHELSAFAEIWEEK